MMSFFVKVIGLVYSVDISLLSNFEWGIEVLCLVFLKIQQVVYDIYYWIKRLMFGVEW